MRDLLQKAARHKLLIVSMGAVSLFATTVFAVSGGPFNPHETTDPNCLPTASTCYVNPPTGGVTIGDTVNGGTPGQVLYTNTAGNVFSDSNFTRNSSTQETIIKASDGTNSSSLDFAHGGLTMILEGSSIFNINDGAGNPIFNAYTLGSSNPVIEMGDEMGIGNHTLFAVDDTTAAIITAADTYNFADRVGSNILTMDTVHHTAQLRAGLSYQNSNGVSGTYTVTHADYYLNVDTSSVGANLTLPAANDILGGGETKIITDVAGNASVNAITITPHAGDTVNGQSSLTIDSNNGSYELHSDGTNNWVVTDYVNFSGGGGIGIGGAVTGGTAHRVLYIDGSGNLAQDSTFLRDPTGTTANQFTVTNGTHNYGLIMNDSHFAAGIVSSDVAGTGYASGATFTDQGATLTRKETGFSDQKDILLNSSGIQFRYGGPAIGNVTYTFPATQGAAGETFINDGSGNLSWGSAGSSTPGGSDTYVQYNNHGAFGGDSNFTWDNTLHNFAVGDVGTAGNGTILRISDNHGTVQAGSALLTSQLFITGDQGLAKLGDGFSNGNQTVFTVDDSQSKITAFGYQASTRGSTTTPVFTGSGLDDIDIGGGFTGGATVSYTVTIDGIDESVISMDVSSIVGSGFTIGETVNDTTSGASATLVSFTTDSANAVSYIVLSSISGTFSNTDSIEGATSGTVAVLNTDLFLLDTYAWTDGSATGAHIPAKIPDATLLSNDITGNFSVGTGHTSGDQWTFDGNPGSLAYGTTFSLDGANNDFRMGDVDDLNDGGLLVIGSKSQTTLGFDNTLLTVDKADDTIAFTFSGGSYTFPNVDGTAGQILQTDGAGVLSWQTPSGGGGSPAGSDTQIQFNNSGSFGADANLTFNQSNGNFIAANSSGLSLINTTTGYRGTSPGSGSSGNFTNTSTGLVTSLFNGVGKLGSVGAPPFTAMQMLDSATHGGSVAINQNSATGYFTASMGVIGAGGTSSGINFTTNAGAASSWNRNMGTGENASISLKQGGNIEGISDVAISWSAPLFTVGNLTNHTGFTVDDTSQSITLAANFATFIADASGNNWLNVNPQGSVVALGNLSSPSGTTFIVDDANQVATITAANGFTVTGFIAQTHAQSCPLEADSSGEIICSTPSDQNLKHNIADMAYGLDTVMKLHPVSYEYNDTRYGSGPQIGFVAQEMEQNIPEVIIHSKDYIGINYALLTSVLAKAIQELDMKVVPMTDLTTTDNSFVHQLIAWLGNSANGITDLFAHTIHSDTVNTNQLCVGTTCVSQSQLQQLLQLESQMQGGSGGGTNTTSTTGTTGGGSAGDGSGTSGDATSTTGGDSSTGTTTGDTSGTTASPDATATTGSTSATGDEGTAGTGGTEGGSDASGTATTGGDAAPN